MGNWWIDNQGVNNLGSTPGKCGEPGRYILPDDSIIGFMLENPRARADFKAIVPTMSPEDQARLWALVARHPRILEKEPNLDPGIQADRLMVKFNVPGFHDPNRRKR